MCLFIVFLISLVFLVWRTLQLQIKTEESSRPEIPELPVIPTKKHMVFSQNCWKPCFFCFSGISSISGLEDSSTPDEDWRVLQSRNIRNTRNTIQHMVLTIFCEKPFIFVYWYFWYFWYFWSGGLFSLHLELKSPPDQKYHKL